LVQQQERLKLFNGQGPKESKVDDTSHYDIRLKKVDKTGSKQEINLRINSLGKYFVP